MVPSIRRIGLPNIHDLEDPDMPATSDPQSLAQSVADLCSAIETEVPALDAHGRYVIPFDEGIELRCFLVGASTVLEGLVHPLPEDHLEEQALLKKLLNASLGKARDRNESLMFDEASREIRLHRRLPQDLDTGSDFVEAVEQFLNELEFWRKYASGDAQQPRTASPFALRP
jgi:hypothetical protein